MNKPLFIHCHIFKNAGTSLIEAFRHAFQEDAIELEPADPDEYLSYADIEEALVNNPQLVFISSHRIKLPLPLFIGNRKIIPIIFFRDPMARLSSVYRFERKEIRPTVYSALAKISSMSIFFNTIIEVGFDVIVSNVHADFCSLSSTYNLNEFQEYLKDHTLVGLVEDSNFSMALIENEMKRYYPEKSLPLFNENVTCNNRDIIANCQKILEEMGGEIYKKLIIKNDIDYRLYTMVYEHLLSKWVVEKNKTIYFNYCKNNRIKIDDNDKRVRSIHSLGFIKNNKMKEPAGSVRFESKWVRLKKISKAQNNKPVLEAVRMADVGEPAVVFVPGQELFFECKTRWPMRVGCPAIRIIIKDHRGKKIFNITKVASENTLSGVDKELCETYDVSIILPVMISGLYSIDVDFGIGLNGCFKVIATQESVLAFGIKCTSSDLI